LGEVLALDGGHALDELAALKVGYAPAEGSRALREAIAAFAGVDPDWVVVTTGASEALSVRFCLASKPGANVVMPFPAFPAFETMANAWGLAARTFLLKRENGFAQAAGQVLESIDGGTALALVNSPHNPTGSAMRRVEIETLAQALSARVIPLIVDEVYHPLYFGAEVASASGIANTIVVGDMSKALSLAGLRMGWIIDADPERRKRIIDARSYFTISGSPILEAIAVVALRNRNAILSRLTSVVEANLALLDGFMQRHADTLSWVRPTGGTVAFPWFRDGSNSRPWCEALAGQGVLVAPGDCFGAPDHFRLGFGAQSEGFGEALELASIMLAKMNR
jgi:aspartate/methionine/tyrosine aminotransferase